MSHTDAQLWQTLVHAVRQGDPDPQLEALLSSLEPQFLSPEQLEVGSSRPLPGDSGERLCRLLGEAASRAWGRSIQVRVRPSSGQLGLPFVRRAATEPHEQLRLNPNNTFDNFVVAPNNRLAHAACTAVCDAPGQAYNPLFLHGTVGLGKTHLLQAICHRLLQRQADVHILYLSCESFVNQFIASVERGELEQFRYRYRHVDVLVIDDIHFLADKERTQEEFFHTFNTLYQAQRQVILSSDSPPHEIPHLEERLVSRFKWGLVARLDKPSFETRVAIVAKKAKLRGVAIPDDVIAFIARTVDTNVRELEGAVTRVGAQAVLAGQPITLETAREVLSDSVPRKPREVMVPEIIAAVVKRYGIRVADLQSKKRNKSISTPRQVAMYLARRLTKLSLEEIGGYFGGRDHTTVLHADRKIEESLAGEPELRAMLESLTEEIQAGPSGAETA
ncbi:MAG TPA: chromosomal replication initiator protein DnaA [Phycisphaerae bacterium]|nr:chromosomal replication initiator protein DnaA [Phycisphaerae bacterium]HOI54781.1 chromosomal replication initiator protein DnaA [Phycisphaerae bacterium]